jgi:uncharacterized protein YcsI (UPF0317 family)
MENENLKNETPADAKPVLTAVRLTKEEADEDGMNLAITRIRAIGHSVGDISNPTFVRIVQIENGDIPCPD